MAQYGTGIVSKKPPHTKKEYHTQHAEDIEAVEETLESRLVDLLDDVLVVQN